MASAVIVGIVVILLGLVGMAVLVSRWELISRSKPSRVDLPKARAIEKERR